LISCQLSRNNDYATFNCAACAVSVCKC